MISPTNRSDTMRAAGLFAIASTVVVCLLWLPFGFGMVGHIEEWDILSLFTRHGVFFFAGEQSPLASHRLRPLTAAPNAVAYLLSPDSFFSMHLLQMGALIAKGIAGGLMGYWLLRSRTVALILALLVIVFPADTMQLSFRSFHINWSVALGMAGVAGLLYSFERRETGKRGGLLLALLSATSLGIAVQIYEVALIFVPFPFLLLWARLGLRVSVQTCLRQLPVTGAWLAAVAICLAYIYSVLSHGSTYQSSVVGGQSATLQLVKERLAALLYTGMGRSLVGGWADAVMILLVEYSTYVYAAACALVVGLFLALSSKAGQGSIDAPQSKGAEAWLLVRTVFIGLIMTALGYLPFLSSPSHLAISQRTFLFSTFGAALATVALLSLTLVGRSRKWNVVAGTLLVTLGLTTQMYQFHHYEGISNTERKVLAEIVTTLPTIEPTKNLIILDGSQRINSSWMLRDNMFNALTYIYGSPVNLVQTCTTPGNAWQRMDRFSRPGLCVQIPGGWAFTDGPKASAPGMDARDPELRLQVDDGNTAVVRVPASFRAMPDAKYLDGNDTLARRYRGVIADRAWPLGFNQFKVQAFSDDFRWDFARWWSLDVPAPGRGWRDDEWQSNGRFKKRSSAWVNLPEASLIFEMRPRNTPYLVRGRSVAIAPGTDRNAIRITINGSEELPLDWTSDTDFQAVVPTGALVDGRNELVLHVPVDMTYYAIGVSLDWIQVSPKP